jgi:aspartyl protease family protein
MSKILVLIAALLGVTVFVVWIAGFSGVSSTSTADSPSLVYNITLLVLLMASLILGWRGSVSQALRYALVWIALFFALLLGYSFRADMLSAWQRVAGEMNPAMPVARSPSEVALRKSNDGHFYVDADINGSSIRLLADTGATTVALSIADAESAGIDADQLEFNRMIFTANGNAAAANVTLDEVRVGSIVRQDVKAMVTRGLTHSLLGMSFFSTLSKVQMENDELILRD